MIKPRYKFWHSTGLWVRDCSYHDWWDYERGRCPYVLDDPRFTQAIT